MEENTKNESGWWLLLWWDLNNRANFTLISQIPPPICNTLPNLFQQLQKFPSIVKLLCISAILSSNLPLNLAQCNISFVNIIHGISPMNFKVHVIFPLLKYFLFAFPTIIFWDTAFKSWKNYLLEFGKPIWCKLAFMIKSADTLPVMMKFWYYCFPIITLSFESFRYTHPPLACLFWLRKNIIGGYVCLRFLDSLRTKSNI